MNLQIYCSKYPEAIKGHARAIGKFAYPCSFFDLLNEKLWETDFQKSRRELVMRVQLV